MSSSLTFHFQLLVSAMVCTAAVMQQTSPVLLRLIFIICLGQESHGKAQYGPALLRTQAAVSARPKCVTQASNNHFSRNLQQQLATRS